MLKGSPRSLRVMAPPPLLYAYHTLGVFRHHPQCGIPTFTGGTCSLSVKIKTTFTVKISGFHMKTKHKRVRQTIQINNYFDKFVVKKSEKRDFFRPSAKIGTFLLLEVFFIGLNKLLENRQLNQS